MNSTRYLTGFLLAMMLVSCRKDSDEFEGNYPMKADLFLHNDLFAYSPYKPRPASGLSIDFVKCVDVRSTSYSNRGNVATIKYELNLVPGSCSHNVYDVHNSTKAEFTQQYEI